MMFVTSRSSDRSRWCSLLSQIRASMLDCYILPIEYACSSKSTVFTDFLIPQPDSFYNTQSPRADHEDVARRYRNSGGRVATAVSLASLGLTSTCVELWKCCGATEKGMSKIGNVLWHSRAADRCWCCEDEGCAYECRRCDKSHRDDVVIRATVRRYDAGKSHVVTACSRSVSFWSTSCFLDSTVRLGLGDLSNSGVTDKNLTFTGGR